MSRNKRRKNRQKKSKQPSNSVASANPIELKPEQKFDEPEQVESERFVYAKEIAERLGVSPTCVRKWRAEGKIALRKLFGSSGPYGMSESELCKLIRGEPEG